MMSSIDTTSSPAVERIIAIGASAGGLAPLQTMLSSILANWPASVFVVLHRDPGSTNHMADVLASRSTLPVLDARDQEPIRAGHVYLAPPNEHLIVNKNEMRVMFGARECHARPAIDMLFRPAAVAYGSQVIGIAVPTRGLSLLGSLE